jgi:hypothetical protein
MGFWTGPMVDQLSSEHSSIQLIVKRNGRIIIESDIFCQPGHQAITSIPFLPSLPGSLLWPL